MPRSRKWADGLLCCLAALFCLVLNGATRSDDSDELPVAEAGPSRTASIGETVVLDGSGSTDVDGEQLRFSWLLLSTPDGSAAVLSDQTAVKPSLTVDRPGAFIAQLIVFHEDAESAADRVTVSTENSAPVAVAGSDRTVAQGMTVRLDGRESTDVDGDALAFDWLLTSAPPGSATVLSDPSSPTPGLVVDSAGSYVAQLIVNDGTTDGPPDTVVLSTENSAPVSHAGPDQTVRVGDIAQLDGARSADADGDLLRFNWSVIHRPGGADGDDDDDDDGNALQDRRSPRPSLLIGSPGIYVVQLVVDDGFLSGNPDTVTISTENSAPVARAGPDRKVSVGETVRLDGGASTDVDGDRLAFDWALATVPAGSAAALSDSDSVDAGFVADRPGVYVARLVVRDGREYGRPDTVTITAGAGNIAPIGDAGPDQLVAQGDLVQLDGRGSRDADSDPLTFRWSIISAPRGSRAALSDPLDARPSFVVNAQGDDDDDDDEDERSGTYVVQLIVDDGTAISAPDTVTISTENVAPVADAGPDRTVFLNDVVQLDGSGSRDSGDDPLTFNWSLTTVPPGSVAALSDPTTEAPGLEIDRRGIYIAQLIVNDGIENSAPDTVRIAAVNRAPVLTPIDDLEIDEGQEQMVPLVAVDADGDPLAFSAVDLPDFVMLIDNGDGTGSLKVAPDFEDAATYTVTVRVSDGDLSDEDEFEITVNDVNRPPSITSSPITTAVQGELYSYDVAAADPDAGDVLTFALDEAPAGMTIDPGTGLVSWIPGSRQRGQNPVSIRVTDDRGLSAIQGFDLTVPAAPLVLAITAPLEGDVFGASPISISGTVNDPDARVLVQDQLTNLTDTAFQADAVALSAEGVNEVVVQARNDAGEQATATVSVILDTRPPILTILSPPDRSIVSDASVPIAGTVFDDTEVTCVVGTTPAIVDADTFESAATLEDGENLVEVTCRDAADNIALRDLTLYLDTDPLAVTVVDPADGAAGVAPSAQVAVSFSEPVDPASVTVANAFLGAGNAILPADIAVSPDGLTATLAPTSGLPSGTTVDVTVTTGVTDAAGIPLLAPFASRFTTAGAAPDAGVVLGEVFDDSRSLPLAGATIDALDPDTGALLASGESDQDGRYLIDPGRTDVLIRVTKSGFTAAERRLATTQGSFAEALDARLTPLAEPRTVSAAFGAELTNGTGDRLAFLPGAVAANTEVTFTAIGPQGLRRPLPVGWAPVGTVEIGTPREFDPAATLSMATRVGAAGREAVFAGYDEEMAAWIALSEVTLTEDGPAVVSGISGPGQFALVLPDLGDGGPEPPALGQALLAGDAAVIPSEAIAVGSVTPPVGRADDPAPAHASVAITAETPLRSGTRLRGDFMELFLLRDGGQVALLDTSQDLIAYRPPADGGETALTADFAIAPSRVFDLTEITEGSISVSLLRSAAVARTLVTTGGGGVHAGDGSRAIVPPGALAGDVPMVLRRDDTAALPAEDYQGFAFLGALELDLAGTSVADSLTLSLAGAAAGVPTGSEVVVAEVRSVRGRQRLVFVALARIDGGALTTVTEVGGVTLPGIRTGGRYEFLRFDGALEIVAGVARDEDGFRLGHLVELEGQPFVSITDAAGFFDLVARPGPFTLTATAATNADQAVVAGRTGIPIGEIVIGATPVAVLSVTVRRPKLEGDFAGPVVLLGKPAPLIVDDGDGDGEIDAGEQVALTLSVRNDGTVEAAEGFFVLDVDGPGGPVTVEPTAIPVETLPPDDPIPVGAFGFSVPAGIDPALLRYTLSYSTAGGLANVMPFALPLGVEHPDVPVDSEITVRFSEPVVPSSLEGAVRLERESDAALEVVETALILSNDTSTLTLRPLKPLIGESLYRLTLAGAIVDRDGRSLASAPVVERIGTEDLTPPAPIDPGRIEVSVPDAEGLVRVSGSAGTVNPDDVVIVLNQTTGVSGLATVATDGSFQVSLRAEVTDQLTVILRDRNGNETTIDTGPFVNRDPVTGAVVSVVVGRRGGVVDGPDGLQLIVPTGALFGATEIALAREPEPFALPADIDGDTDLTMAFEALFAVADRVRIDADAGSFAAPLGLSLPAPDGALVGDRYLLVRARPVTIGGPLADLDRFTGIPTADNPIQTVERLEVVDTATVKDETGTLVLSTDSPPFPGITGPDVLTLLQIKAPLTFLAGEVRRDTPLGPPVPGAVIRSLPDALATAAFAAISDRSGRFVVPDAAVGGPYLPGDIASSLLDVDDPDFHRVIRRAVLGEIGPLSPPDTEILHLDDPFILPDRMPAAIINFLGDIEPPVVDLQIDGPFQEGIFVPVGSPLTITVSALDNDMVEFVSLEIDSGAGFVPVALSPDGIFEFIPTADGVATFKISVRDRSGNIASAEQFVRSFEGDAPSSKPGEFPTLDATSCTDTPNRQRELAFDEDIVVTFSEPIVSASINNNTVQLTEEYKDGDQILQKETVPIKLSAEDPERRLQFRIQPLRNLRLGSTQRVTLTAEIWDDNQQLFGGKEFTCRVSRPSLHVIRSDSFAGDSGLDGVVEDVAVMGDLIIAVDHPENITTQGGGAASDRGHVHVLREKLDADGRFEDLIPVPVTCEPRIIVRNEPENGCEVAGWPLSLAVDGTRVYVGNRFLGPIATEAPFFTGSVDSEEDILFFSSGASGTPSNLQIFDLDSLTSPDRIFAERIGALLTNRLPPSLWNPNTWPNRVEFTDQGVAVLHYLDNVEFISDTPDIDRQGVAGWVPGFGETLGRCFGGTNHDKICEMDRTYSRFESVLRCPDAFCVETREFLDAVFFDRVEFDENIGGYRTKYYAASLERDRVRLLATNPDRLNLNPNSGPSYQTVGTIRSFELGADTASGGLLGIVEDFELLDDSGQPDINNIKDLVFLVTNDDRLTIIDVNDPSEPEVLYPFPTLLDSLPVFGSMSFDPCHGLAYVHGRNGEFNIVDFNDPSNPFELNAIGADSSPPFEVTIDDSNGGNAGTVPFNAGLSFNGIANNQNGVVYLAGPPGLAVVTLGHGGRTKFPLRRGCLDLQIAGVPDVDELLVGGFVGLNKDDDNANGLADLGEAGQVTDENDLMKLTLSVGARDVGDQVTLSTNSAGHQKIRVWTNATRDEQVILPATFDASQTPNHLYVEGVETSETARDILLTLSFVRELQEISDFVRITVMNVELEIHNGLKGIVDRTQENEQTPDRDCKDVCGIAISEIVEESLGAITVANLNDSDSDSNIDKEDFDGVLGEVDLMELEMSVTPDDGGVYRLQVLSGDIAFWDNSSKSPSDGSSDTPEISEREFDATESNTVWVEARDYSRMPQDIQIELEYKGITDTVAATAVWVTLEQVYFERCEMESSNMCKDSVNRPIDTIPAALRIGADEGDPGSLGLVKNLEFAQADDGSLYGRGTFKLPTIVRPNSDNQIGGRILFEWKVNPQELDEDLIVFDATRQRDTRVLISESGRDLLFPVKEFTGPFPVVDEMPNDDCDPTNNNFPDDLRDEANNPINDSIFSFDGPGTSLRVPRGFISIGVDAAFQVGILNFHEWVRIKLDGDFKGPVAACTDIRGSRASDRVNWHLVQYLRRNAMGEFEEDSESLSNSAPQRFSLRPGHEMRGNGDIEVTCLAGQPRVEGYRVTYERNSDGILGWTIEDCLDEACRDFNSRPVSQWEVEVPNRVKIEITESSSKPFVPDDQFLFSCFETSRGQKTNSIGRGLILIPGEP